MILLWLALAAILFVAASTFMTQIAVMSVSWVEANREVPPLADENSFLPVWISWSGLMMIARDWFCLFCIILSTPFGWTLPAITERFRQETGGPLIVLVHGFQATASAYGPALLRMRWRKMGNVVCVNLPSPLHSIDDMAAALRQDLIRLGVSPKRQAVLVGKSMGGLVVRRYLERYGKDGVLAGAATIGTPHRGSYAACVGMGVCGRQMQPNSAFIERLNADEHHYPCPTLGIWSDTDTYVSPTESAIWPDADENHRVSGLGHTYMQNHGAVLTLLQRFYEKVTRLSDGTDDRR